MREECAFSNKNQVEVSTLYLPEKSAYSEPYLRKASKDYTCPKNLQE